MRTIFLLVFIFASFSSYAQVGIGTTSPNPSSQLDVSSTDKGILVPKVALPNVNTTMLDGVNTAAVGLLIYNTNAAISGGNGVGHYYFNGSTWERLTTSATSEDDQDWFEEGTSSSPDDITDDIFTQGNVAIGKTTADYPLDIDASDAANGILVSIDDPSSSSPRYAQYNSFTTTTTGESNGLGNYFSINSGGTFRGVFNDFLDGTGTGIAIGVESSIIGNSSNAYYGLITTLTGTGSGQREGVQNNLRGSGDGIQYAVFNEISNSGDGFHYGMNTQLSGNGSGPRVGLNNEITGTGNGNRLGLTNTFNGTGTGSNVGVLNTFSSNANNYQLGFSNNFTGDGANSQVGFRNQIFNETNGSNYGLENVFGDSGNALRIGLRNSFGGSGNGAHYGVQSVINNTGDGDHYGVSSAMSGAGTGDHYGTHASFTGIGTGSHYGFYSQMNGSGVGSHYGMFNTLSGSATGSRIGMSNEINSTNNSSHIGAYNELSGSGSGTHVGSYSLLSGTGSGIKLGFYAIVTGNGNNVHIGSSHSLSGTGTGEHYGTRNSLGGSGAGDHYGTYTDLFSSGAGNKYGSFIEIANTAGGTHYGVYSDVQKPGSYAGYFSGDVRVSTLIGAGNRMVIADANGILGTQAIPASGDITSVTAGDGLIGGGTSGAVTLNVVATNGLTDNANDVVLGGLLTQNTTISNGNFDLNVNLTGSGGFNVQDVGTNHFSVSPLGDISFGGDVYWRDENSLTGSILGEFVDDGNDGRFIIRENAIVSVDLDANSQFIFNEQGLDRNFRVESEGEENAIFVDGNLNNVGIKTGTPERNLQVNSDRFTGTSDGGLSINQSFTGNEWTLYPSQSSDALSLYYNGNLRGAFNSVNGTYAPVSDRRLKKNIQDLEPVLDKILEIKTKSYHLKEQNSKAKRSIGVIAQELEKLFPEAVNTLGDDTNGTGLTTTKTVSYTDLIPVLIKGMQEQQEQIETLKQEINDLKKTK